MRPSPVVCSMEAKICARACENRFGRISAALPPAVADRLLLSALGTVIACRDFTYGVKKLSQSGARKERVLGYTGRALAMALTHIMAAAGGGVRNRD